jgi:hypothetical protein
MLEVRHLHTRYHSSFRAFAIVLEFDSNTVFEAYVTRHMCARLVVGVRFSAPYAHHMLGKAERPWRTLRDNAFEMLHSISAPNPMWSCAIMTDVYLRNRTYSRVVGLSGAVLLTMLTSKAPDASKFRVFGCTVFAKVHGKFPRKPGDKCSAEA